MKKVGLSYCFVGVFHTNRKLEKISGCFHPAEKKAACFLTHFKLINIYTSAPFRHTLQGLLQQVGWSLKAPCKNMPYRYRGP